MFILGILILAAGIFWLTLLSANFDLSKVIPILFNGSTAFAFILVIASVIISTGEFKTFIKALNTLLSKKYSISASDKEKSIRLFKLLGKSITYASILMSVIGLSLILFDLSDIFSLGSSIFYALLSIFYGTFINMAVINPAINILETRCNTEGKTLISEKQVLDKLMELCRRQGVSPEEILAADEMQLKKYGK